jgi:hypothetical protein
MSPLFIAASEMAEHSLDLFCAALFATEAGRRENAKGLLEGIAWLCETDLYETLCCMEQEVAGVAQGIITINGHYFASAHEAVAFVWSVTHLLMANHPNLPEWPDLMRWFNRFNTSLLRAHLIRERSRLLATCDQGKAKAATTGRSDKSRTRSLDAQALALFLEHNDWTKKQIASKLGCNEKSLCPRRCPHLRAAIAACKSRRDPGKRTVRGSVDKKGNLQAWVEDE